MTFRRSRIRGLIRQFKENGMKMMLEHPANVRDVLSLVQTPWLGEIDFHRLEQIKTTFIRRDYRHLHSDIVLTAPLAGGGEGERRRLLIYILIEHQSEPDRLMPLRLADSQLQIFRYQVRNWSRIHGLRTRVRLFPVLPVVFYTGLRRWPQVGSLVDLIERGEEFRPVTPIVERPLFVNLPELRPAKLQREGGFFGWVLQLVQQRKTRVKEFRQLLQRVVNHLESMPPAERARWRDLLSYIGAMIYHERSEKEQPELHATIEHSVTSDDLRQEVLKMEKTMAEVLTERGRLEGETQAAIRTRQQTLLRLLRKRFGDVSPELACIVESTTDVEQLDDWLDRLVIAHSLEELEIKNS